MQTVILSRFRHLLDKFIQKPVLYDSNDPPFWHLFSEFKTNILTDRDARFTYNSFENIWSGTNRFDEIEKLTNKFTRISVNCALFDPSFGHLLQVGVPMHQIHIGDRWFRQHSDAISQAIVSIEQHSHVSNAQFHYTNQPQIVTVFLVSRLCGVEFRDIRSEVARLQWTLTSGKRQELCGLPSHVWLLHANVLSAPWSSTLHL